MEMMYTTLSSLEEWLLVPEDQRANRKHKRILVDCYLLPSLVKQVGKTNGKIIKLNRQGNDISELQQTVQDLNERFDMKKWKLL
jgi:hypothetical protein